MQLPLPKHLDEEAVIHVCDPKKDVDGFHPQHRLAQDIFCGPAVYVGTRE